MSFIKDNRSEFSQSSRGWKVQEGGAGRAGSSRGLSPWLADSHRLLPVSSHGYPCVMSVSKFLYSRIYKDAHQAGSESTLMTSFYLLLFLAVLGL